MCVAFEQDDEVDSASETDPATISGGGQRAAGSSKRRPRQGDDVRRRSSVRRRQRLRDPRSNPMCVFHERHSVDGYTELQSAYNQSWYVAFGRSGLTRRFVAVEDDSPSTSFSSSKSRRSRQFLKTDFAYVDSGRTAAVSGGGFDGSAFKLTGKRHRTRHRGYGRGHQVERHDYHGPSIDYHRLYAQLRGAASTADGSATFPASSSSSEPVVQRTTT